MARVIAGRASFASTCEVTAPDPQLSASSRKSRDPPDVRPSDLAIPRRSRFKIRHAPADGLLRDALANLPEEPSACSQCCI
jgi:hypothetical protein